MKTIIRYPVSVVDHLKTIKDPVQDDVNELKEFRDEQQAVVPDNIIKGVKEIENFLANTSDSETLVHLLETLTSSIVSEIPTKVSDLPNDAGYLTEHQSLDEYYTKDDSKDLSAFLSLSAQSIAGTTSVTTNSEWKLVYTDANDKILLAKKQDNTWFAPIEISVILDTAISGLSAS